MTSTYAQFYQGSVRWSAERPTCSVAGKVLESMSAGATLQRAGAGASATGACQAPRVSAAAARVVRAVAVLTCGAATMGTGHPVWW